jgi:hypothetical protein
MFIEDHQMVFEGCFKNINESRSLFLASRLTQLLRPRTKDKLHYLGGSHTCSFGYTPTSKGYFMVPYILWHLMLLK